MANDLALIFLLLSGLPVEGLVYTSQLTSSTPVYPSDDETFGFLEGGSVTLKLRCSAPPGRVDFAVLTQSQLSETTFSCLNATAKLNTTHRAVRLVDVGWASYQRSGTDYDAKVAAVPQIATKDGPLSVGSYAFVLAACGLAQKHRPESVSCSATLVLLNPGEEQLSSDHIIVPDILTGSACVWGFVLIYWLVNFVTHSENSNGLHKLVGGAAFLKIIEVAVDLVKYHELRKIGMNSAALLLVETIVGAVAVTTNFWIILAVSYGYCIVGHYERKVFHMHAALTSFYLVSEILSSEVHEYFSGLSAIFGIGMTVLFLQQIGTRTLELRGRFVELQSLGLECCLPLLQKRFLFGATRALFCIYALGWLVLTVCESSDTFGVGGDISMLCSQVLSLTCCIVLVIIFRLRDLPEAEDSRVEEETQDNQNITTKGYFSLIELPHGRQHVELGVVVTDEQFRRYTRKMVRGVRKRLRSGSSALPIDAVSGT